MAHPRCPDAPWLLLQAGGRFLSFERPRDVLEALDPGSVREALARCDTALAAGSWVAGFLCYEAAAAFGLAVRPPDPDGLPLLWFGLFDAPGECCLRSPARSGGPPPGGWAADVAAAEYEAAVAEIQQQIAAGNTYQANYTFRLGAPLREDPRALFARLVAAQRPRHAALVDLGRFVVASASPELFFEREGTLVRARPMKGTAPRGLDLEEDEAAAAALRGSEKDRAENLMILDMLRNDLGRVADVGSVEVASLFEIERYPTLLQMTSTVTARSAAPLSSLVAALFPCASVTGAPRASTMRLLARCERAPRGVYTGAIGWAAPDGRASFNVAIRTVVADRERGTLAFGTGSGIVADSLAARERDECLLKARVLEEEPFALLETLALLPGEGLRSLAGHLLRLSRSAEYFGIPLDGPGLQARLRELASRDSGPRRVRVLVNANGCATISVADLPPPQARPLRVGFARGAVASRDPWLRHKTTRRAVYEQALASRRDCDDVLLWNERGEVTEASVANVAFELEGREVTPPLSCGLLPGVERARLLAAGELQERVVRRDELRPGCRLHLVSSLRGRRVAELVE